MLWQVCAAIAGVVGVLVAFPIGQGAVPNSNTCDACNNPVGSWGAWGAWSSCHTNTFGLQVITRTRACSTTFCPYGTSEEEASCSLQQPAPAPATWGSWGAWSACSRTCGGGIMTRSRVCSCGVCQCPGSSTEQETCNSQACPCTTCYNPVPAPIPVPAPCTTCYNPAPAPIPVPSPSPVCTTCNPAPAPCATCGQQQPFYNPYGNGRKRRELLLSQMKANVTGPKN